MPNSDEPGKGRAEQAANHELAQDFERLEVDFRDLENRVDRLAWERLKKLAGTEFEIMLRSRDETLKYLTHSKASLRHVALELAYSHWKITGILAQTYEETAFADPDAGVREAAIAALGTCYARTKDARICRLLAGVIRNQDAPQSMRLTAFSALLRVHRNIDYTGKSPLVPTSLEEVDWAFVNGYYFGPSGN